MNHVRRPSLLTAGEPLLLSRSTIETTVRFGAFVEESGLPEEAVLSSVLCACPLPIYTAFGVNAEGRPRRRWAGTRAEFMWHPLMWLPPRVAGRYQITDASGTARKEDDDLWAIRMALELTASGLYDPTTATWVDILATVGLDVDNDLDLARVQDWLDGYPDDLLDSIDLSDFMDISSSPSWALESALSLREDLEFAAWALVADDLLDMTDEAINPNNRLSNDDLLMALRSIAGLGESLLPDVPNVTSDGVSTGAGAERHVDFFIRLHDEIDLESGTPLNYVVLDYLAQARERLHAIREAYWPYLEALSNIEGTDAPAPVGV